MARKTRVDAYGILDPETGDVKLYNRVEFRNELKEMNYKGSEKYPQLDPVKIKVTVRRTDITITSRQRGYFYGVVVKLIQTRLLDYGNRVDQKGVIRWLKESFMYREVFDKISGKIIKEHISLSDNEDALTKEEFQKAKEAIQQFCAQEMELNIPDPREKVTSEQ